jgi:hypothetical protein
MVGRNAKCSGGVNGIRYCPVAGAPAALPCEPGSPYRRCDTGTVYDLQLGVLGAYPVLFRVRVFLLAVFWQVATTSALGRFCPLRTWRLPNDPNIDRKQTRIQEDLGLVCGLGDRILKIRLHCLALWLPPCLRPSVLRPRYWRKQDFHAIQSGQSWPCWMSRKPAYFLILSIS